MKTVEIVKQVKLTPNQRLALVAAANNGNVAKNLDFSTRETLCYLGLIEEFRLNDPAKLRADVAKAWKQLGIAAKNQNITQAETALSVITHERWEADKRGWRLTAAASEYLDKGRIVLTVGKELEAKKTA